MKSLRLLLVEDSPSDVRLVREALNETGIPVELTVMADGAAGMEFLHRVELGLEHRPDLILLDLNLPKKNGREVLAEIKSAPLLKQLPVLIMTSSQSDEDISQCYTLNANCFITKPCDLNEYLKAIKAIEEFWFLTATLPENDSFAGRMPLVGSKLGLDGSQVSQ